MTRSESDNSLSIRALRGEDVPDVMAIERVSFAEPWAEDRLDCCLRHPECIGSVAVRDGRITGFMVVQVRRRRFEVLRFAVGPEWRRHGVGTAMLEKLRSRLSPGWIDTLCFLSSAAGPEGRGFLQARGLKARALKSGGDVMAERLPLASPS